MIVTKTDRVMGLEEVQVNSQIFIKDLVITADECQDIIKTFEEFPDNQFSGRVGDQSIKPEVKKNTQIHLKGQNEDYKAIDEFLYEIIKSLLAEFHTVAGESGYLIPQGTVAADEVYQISRYLPGDYYKVHVDALPTQPPIRSLNLLLYLNEVEEGGETEFPAQNLSIEPRPGRAVLFPPHWTHPHEGKEVIKGEKYVVVTHFITQWGAINYQQ